MRFHIVPAIVALGLGLALTGCARSEGSVQGSAPSASPATHVSAPAVDQRSPSHAGHGSTVTTAAMGQAAPGQIVPAAASGVALPAFSGTREETTRFIEYFRNIPLTPEQERTKVEALTAIPAPCCAENPLSTCCCPCNMAKAAWGLSAWLITEKGFGAEQVREATRAWLAATNPGGFSGDACHSGGCARKISQNGCGGMKEAEVL